ncbi:uncharacterized protein LOC119577601 [Penaeus monodon]|uniref:uncharacterized protein LOC119577601 n=1 Tax=Penaeus monodon TaxID=6687 RepID=UPI0018A7A8C3|nr:uncharacterized protein LOC119577601 [Penaeus monodon]
MAAVEEEQLDPRVQSDRHGTEGEPATVLVTFGCRRKDVIEDRHRPADRDFVRKGVKPSQCSGRALPAGLHVDPENQHLCRRSPQSYLKLAVRDTRQSEYSMRFPVS